jgi:hypothetical protein
MPSNNSCEDTLMLRVESFEIGATDSGKVFVDARSLHILLRKERYVRGHGIVSESLLGDT